MIGPSGTFWIAMPDIKRRDEEDCFVLVDGRPVYDAILEFRDKQARAAFNKLILDALQADNPEAFDEEPPR